LKDNATSVLGKNKKRKGKAKSGNKKAKTSKPKPVKKKAAPKKYSENWKKDWFIENFENDRTLELTEDECKLNRKLFLFNLNNCLVKVHSKINMISLNKCVKTSLVFESVVGQIEVVDSKGLKI